MEHRKRLNRIQQPQTKISDPFYLFNHYFVPDLKRCIEQYVSGDLLDVGCGNKPYEVYTSTLVNKHIGCDITQSDLNKVDVLCKATELSFDNEMFHTVLSTQVLEHLEEPDKAIAEIYRVLKYNGIAILSTNLYWPLHEEPYDFFRFTKYGLSYLFQKNGFKVEEIVMNGGMWAMHGQSLLININKSLSTSRKPLKRLIYLIYRISGFKYWVNFFYSFLDRIDKNEACTTNYIVVARKAETQSV